MKLNHLKSNPKNSRKITLAAMEKLKKSIQNDPEFMVLKPIIYDIDRGNIILAGNQRFRACQEVGMVDIPDEWTRAATGLSDKQCEKFIILDNNPEVISGSWDFDALKVSFDFNVLEEFGLSTNREIDINETQNKIENEEEWLEAHDRVEKRAEKIHKKIESLVEANPTVFDKAKVIFINPDNSKCLIIVDDTLSDFIDEIKSHKGEGSPLENLLDKSFEL